MNINYFKAIVLSVFLILPFSINAQESQSDSRLTDSECRSLSDLAGSIMKSRQSGVPMTRAMGITDDIELPSFKELVRSFVIQAYKEPHYQSEKYKQRAIVSFSDNIYLECLNFVGD